MAAAVHLPPIQALLEALSSESEGLAVAEAAMCTLVERVRERGHDQRVCQQCEMASGRFSNRTGKGSPRKQVHTYVAYKSFSLFAVQRKKREVMASLRGARSALRSLRMTSKVGSGRAAGDS